MDLLIRQSANLIDISLDGVNGLPQELIDALTPMLTYTHKKMLHGAESYDQVTGERRRVQITHPKLYRIDSGRVCTGAGFTQAVTAKLQALGHRVYYVDLTPPHPRADRYTVHPSAVDGLIQYRARQDECVAAILANRGGIIKAPTGFGKTTLMSACSLIHPKAKIHIVVKQVSIAHRIIRQLVRFLPSVGMIGDGKYKPGRVTVITADSLHKSDGDADFLFVDECISGEARISTPTGYKPMKDVVIGDQVLCYDGQRVVSRVVTNKWFKGRRPSVVVAAGHLKLGCTICHAVADRQHWTRVSELNQESRLWSLAPAGVVQYLVAINGGVRERTFSATGGLVDLDQSGGHSGIHYGGACLSVSVDAVGDSSLLMVGPLISSSPSRVVKSTLPIYQGTPLDPLTTESGLRTVSDRQFSGRCWVTPALDIPIRGAGILGLSLTTGMSRTAGQDTRLISYRVSMSRSQWWSIEGSGPSSLDTGADVCQPCERCISLSTAVSDKSTSPLSGSIHSAGSASHGGFVTTGRAVRQACVCTPRVSTGDQLSVSCSGCDKSSVTQPYTADALSDGTSTSVGNAATTCGDWCIATYRTPWRISEQRLTTIEKSVDVDVWDIEVDGCHNFFADGLLVHNCHNIVTDNYSTKIVERYKYSRNFGFSATPYSRNDGAHARLHGMLGPTIFEMTYQEAVALGLTVQIKVHWLPIRMDRNPAAGKTNDVVRKRHGIWQNAYRNAEFGKAVAELDPDAQVLALVETVEHAVHLWQHMPSFQLCYSEMKPHDHQEYIRKGFLPQNFVNVTAEMRYNMQLAFERNELKRVIATDVWSTGVDFDNLSVVVRADARGSEIMDTQGPGRASRVKDGKAYGHVIDAIDYFDRNWQTTSRGRYQTYESLGWEQDWPTGRRHFANSENTQSKRTGHE